MAKQPLNQNKKMSEQAGMDMSLPGAAKRWKEILAWVHAELAVDNPQFGACSKVPDTWKPCTKEEQVEERFLRRLLQADTAERIGQACCSAFLIKGLASPEDEKSFRAVEIEEAFRLLAQSFNLSDAESYKARQFADSLKEESRVMCGADTAALFCAMKFNVIRREVEQAKQIADFSDTKTLTAKLLAKHDKSIVNSIRQLEGVVPKKADIAAHVKKAVDKAIAPIVQEAEAFKKARLLSTPPHERQWWQNLRAAHDRESAPTQSAKWHAVAHMVVLCANAECQKPARAQQCDYLTPRMLRTLINKLKKPGANNVEIEAAYADTLRRYVTRKEQKAAK